jgi:glycosyltransferase involved in cell wall biosynthesis
MRILMTADSVGGVWTYVVELGSWLLANGANVVVATMGRALTSQQREQLTRRGMIVEESEYRLEWMEDPWTDVAEAGQWLRELERKHRPDVVHLNGYAHGASGFRAPVMIVAHSSVLSWWRAVFGTDAPASYDRYRTETTRGLRAAARVVAPSHAMLDSLLQHEPWLDRLVRRGPTHDGSSKVRVIENGLTIPPFTRPQKRDLILAAGRLWDQAKNVELLARAAPALPWPIVIAGERQLGEREPPFDASALDCLGALRPDELARWMRSAAIFAAPALYEPFGLSILEAAAAGCALVLGDIPSLRELWGGAAELVDPRDPVAWQRSLQSLADDSIARRRLALSAYARAQRYSAGRMGAAYLRLYTELARPVQRSVALAGGRT